MDRRRQKTRKNFDNQTPSFFKATQSIFESGLHKVVFYLIEQFVF